MASVGRHDRDYHGPLPLVGRPAEGCSSSTNVVRVPLERDALEDVCCEPQGHTNGNT